MDYVICLNFFDILDLYNIISMVDFYVLWVGVFFFFALAEWEYPIPKSLLHQCQVVRVQKCAPCLWPVFFLRLVLMHYHKDLFYCYLVLVLASMSSGSYCLCSGM
jgi:hypothetical protein